MPCLSTPNSLLSSLQIFSRIPSVGCYRSCGHRIKWDPPGICIWGSAHEADLPTSRPASLPQQTQTQTHRHRYANTYTLTCWYKHTQGDTHVHIHLCTQACQVGAVGNVALEQGFRIRLEKQRSYTRAILDCLGAQHHLFNIHTD